VGNVPSTRISALRQAGVAVEFRLNKLAFMIPYLVGCKGEEKKKFSNAQMAPAGLHTHVFQS